VRKIEHKADFRHRADEILARIGQSAGFTGSAAKTVASPGESDDTQSAFPPGGQFVEVKDTFSAFHKRDDANRFLRIRLVLPKVKVILEFLFGKD